MNRQAVLRTILYVICFVFFTLFFLLVNFPSERLTTRINGWMLSSSNGTVTVENARIKLPLSLVLGGITLKHGHGSLDLGEAVVGMRFLGLLTGKKAAKVRLENPWLNSKFTLVSSGEEWDLDVRSMEVDLSELPDDIMTLPLSLEGKLEVSLKLHSKDPSQGVSSGDIRITSGPVEIAGDLLETLGFAPLLISRMSAVGTVEDNVLSLGENFIEGDLIATARGEIKVTPSSYMSSRLNLTAEVKPGSEARERLLPVFTLMGARPGADGSINIRIRGTMGKPSITM